MLSSNIYCTCFLKWAKKEVNVVCSSHQFPCWRFNISDGSESFMKSKDHCEKYENKHFQLSLSSRYRLDINGQNSLWSQLDDDGTKWSQGKKRVRAVKENYLLMI